VLQQQLGQEVQREHGGSGGGSAVAHGGRSGRLAAVESTARSPGEAGKAAGYCCRIVISNNSRNDHVCGLGGCGRSRSDGINAIFASQHCPS
jgi:hypothetical protein